jgi:hypothetical protein
MYIMTPEPISPAYFINPSHLSVCLYVYPPTVARQCVGKSNNRTVGRIVFYVVCVVSKESRQLVILRTSCDMQQICNDSNFQSTGHSDGLIGICHLSKGYNYKEK